MIFNNEPHECRNHSALKIKGYRTSIFEGKSDPMFKIRTRNEFEVCGVEFYYFNANDQCFDQFHDGLVVLSPSTSGLFITENCTKYNTLVYESTKFVEFSFYIGLMKYDAPEISLRAIVCREGIILVKCNVEMFNNTRALSIKDRYSMNTVFILGIQPRGNNFQLQIQFGSTCQKVKWQKETGWNLDQFINVINVRPADTEDLRYLNCNKGHNVEQCYFPTFTAHCSGCLIVSIDGSQHENPCMPINRISKIRSDLLARNALTLFRLIYSPNEVEMLYLTKDHIFTHFERQRKLLSAPTESILVLYR